jgi:hypothetical protein
MPPPVFPGTYADSGIPVIPDRSQWDFSDFYRSFGSGLVSGGNMLVGLPGDIKQAIASAHDQYIRPIEQRLGYQGPSPEMMQQVYAQQPSLMPTSAQLSKAAEALLGPPHQPQTDPGDLAFSVGQKIPGIPLFLATRGRWK